MRIRPSESLREIVILYVEDDDGIREALSQIIRRYVHTLYTARNGEEGLALFLKHRPEIVISDIRMPVMDGLEMVRRIKEASKEASIIFTTAFGESGYLKEAIDMGVEGYLIKPIDRNRLMEKLNFLADAIVNERRKSAFYRLLTSLFDMQKEAILLVDEYGSIVLSNLAYKKLCMQVGCEDDTRFGDIAFHFVEDDACIVMPPLEENVPVTRWFAVADGKTVCLEIAGKKRYFDVHVKPVDNLYFIEFIDVSRFQEKTIRLEQENVIDSLTGVYNRKIEPKVIDELIGEGESVCCLMCDLDHFKRINDTYGHAVGDEVLRRVAAIFKSSLREDDYLIRWGGEEFVVLLHGHRNVAMKVAQKLKNAVATRDLPTVGKITVSIGVGCIEVESRDDYEALILKADEALYRAKELGRDRVEWCAEDA